LPAAESQPMNQQGAVLLFNVDERVWELVATDADDPVMAWEVEANALRDLAADGWQVEGPFRTCLKVAGLPKAWFVGFGLRGRTQ
jgi:hypothetical protein